MNIEQEKLLGEKNKEMEEVRRDLEQAKANNQGKDDEVRVLCREAGMRSWSTV